MLRAAAQALLSLHRPCLQERRRIRSWNDSQLPVQWKFLSPLVWAPAFPVIRLSLSKFPRARTYIIAGAIVVANFHGVWLINNPDLTDL